MTNQFWELEKRLLERVYCRSLIPLSKLFCLHNVFAQFGSLTSFSNARLMPMADFSCFFGDLYGLHTAPSTVAHKYHHTLTNTHYTFIKPTAYISESYYTIQNFTTQKSTTHFTITLRINKNPLHISTAKQLNSFLRHVPLLHPLSSEWH